jgi:dipeptidase E
MRFTVTELDIEHATRAEMQKAINDTDIVYIAGGNTFHLLKQLRVSGFDKLLTAYVDTGGMYIGASAGALVAGADIAPISAMDEPEKSDLSSTRALGFVDIIPIPHTNENTKKDLLTTVDNPELVFLTDDKAILVEDDTWQVV